MKIFKIITLFPEIFPGILSKGVLKATYNKSWIIQPIDIKDYGYPLDDRPCGGGPGMIFKPNVLEKILDPIQGKIIYLSPRGRIFNQKIAQELLQYNEITFLCGRFEGVDQRIIDYYNLDEISLGDFILCGGESALIPIIETIARLIPGSVGNKHSLEEESFSNNLLENHLYTKPIIWRNQSVPSILLSGHNLKIKLHKYLESLLITFIKRPDLYKKHIIYIFLWFNILCKRKFP